MAFAGATPKAQQPAAAQGGGKPGGVPLWSKDWRDEEGLARTKLLPVIKFREHCITCFSCEIFCPEHIVDVHPSVKNRPRPW